MNVTLAKELCELGEVALAAGDSARAIYHYTQAIEAQADCAEAWFGRGRAHADSEAWPKAVDDLTHALRLNPEDLGVRINRPMALAGAGRIQEAQSEWDALVRHESSYIGCWLGRASFRLAYLGYCAGACEDAREAMRIDPHEDVTYSVMCRALLREGCFEQADKVVRLGLSRIPGSDTLRCMFGLTSFYLWRLDEAAPLLRESFARDMGEDVLHELVQVHIDLGDWQKARQYLDHFDKQRLDSAERRLLSAQCNLGLGRLADAAQDLSSAAEHHKESTDPDRVFDAASFYAQRAALVDRYKVAGFDPEADRQRAGTLLKQLLRQDSRWAALADQSRLFSQVIESHLLSAEMQNSRVQHVARCRACIDGL